MICGGLRKSCPWLTRSLISQTDRPLTVGEVESFAYFFLILIFFSFLFVCFIYFLLLLLFLLLFVSFFGWLDVATVGDVFNVNVLNVPPINGQQIA